MYGKFRRCWYCGGKGAYVKGYLATLDRWIVKCRYCKEVYSIKRKAEEDKPPAQRPSGLFEAIEDAVHDAQFVDNTASEAERERDELMERLSIIVEKFNK